MRQKVLRLSITFIIAFLGIIYGIGIWYFSDVTIRFPKHDLESARQKALADGLLSDRLPEPKEVALDVGDGIMLSGWFFEHPAEGDCGAVLLHGWQGTRYQSFQFVPLLWERGCHLLMYDARNHGESSETFGTYGYYEKMDALKALDWFRQRTGLDTYKIGLVGHSYGAAAALQAAPYEPQLAFVLADSSYRNMPAILWEHGVELYGPLMSAIFLPPALALSGLRAGFNPLQVSPASAVGEAGPPVLLVHSLQDTFISPRHASKIYSHCAPQRCILHLTDWGAPHTESIRVDPESYTMIFEDFLDHYDLSFGTMPQEAK